MYLWQNMACPSFAIEKHLKNPSTLHKHQKIIRGTIPIAFMQLGELLHCFWGIKSKICPCIHKAGGRRIGEYGVAYYASCRQNSGRD
jgi:hypothetical protein